MADQHSKPPSAATTTPQAPSPDGNSAGETADQASAAVPHGVVQLSTAPGMKPNTIVAGPALAKPQSTTPSLKPNTVAAPDTPDKTS